MYGVGSGLIQRAIEDAEERNTAELHVWAEFDNRKAIEFYTKHGFRKRSYLFERDMGTIS